MVRIQGITCTLLFFRLSASCVHVSALLHALVALKPGVQSCGAEEESDVDSDEDSTPVTSLLCQWKPPKKHKATAMQVSMAEFENMNMVKLRSINCKALKHTILAQRN